MTDRRRSRQRAEVLRAARAGDRDRALVLAREHLVEFPDDDAVAALLGPPAGEDHART
jgi:hypothetical protein